MKMIQLTQVDGSLIWINPRRILSATVLTKEGINGAGYGGYMTLLAIDEQVDGLGTSIVVQESADKIEVA